MLVIALALLAATATEASADLSADYAFTLNHRYVSGRDNGHMYDLDGGFIGNSGHLWLTSRDPGSNPTPLPIRVQVYRDGGFFDLEICDTVVTPTATVGERVPFQEVCGQHPADRYYVVAFKPEDDGWNVEATGTLVSSLCQEVSITVNEQQFVQQAFCV